MSSLSGVRSSYSEFDIVPAVPLNIQTLFNFLLSFSPCSYYPNNVGFFYLRTYVPLISEITLFWKFIGLPWQRWVWLCPSGTCFQFWMNYLLMITSSKIQNSQFDTCNNLDINNNLSKLAMKVNHEDGHPNGSPRYIVSSNWTLRWANKHEKNRRV